jgi:threonine aldolase
VADYLGKEDAIFLPSGVMAQNIVLMQASAEREGAATPRRRHFICDHTSHLLLHEKDAHTLLLGLVPVVVPPNMDRLNQRPISFADVDALLDDVANVSTLIVELPHREIGGKCPPFEDLIKMSEKCRKNGIQFHMDGARLWEASAAFEQPLSAICALFDSVFVSFYKGLGGIAGSMLLGTKAETEHWKAWLRRFGGNTFSQLPTAVSCWHGFVQNKDSFPTRKQRLQEVVAAVSKAVGAPAEAGEAVLAGGWTVRFDPPVPEVSLVHAYFNHHDPKAVMEVVKEVAAREGIKVCAGLRPAILGAAGQSYFEFNMGPGNLEIPVETWVKGFTAVAEAIKALAKI